MTQKYFPSNLIQYTWYATCWCAPWRRLAGGSPAAWKSPPAAPAPGTRWPSRDQSWPGRRGWPGICPGSQPVWPSSYISLSSCFLRWFFIQLTFNTAHFYTVHFLYVCFSCSSFFIQFTFNAVNFLLGSFFLIQLL